MDDPKSFLQSLGGERESVPVIIEGMPMRCRTMLTVSDVMALPEQIFTLNPIALSCVLFRILGTAAIGASFFDENDAWFNDVTALQIHRGMREAGVAEKVFGQLVAGEGDGVDEGKTQEAA